MYVRSNASIPVLGLLGLLCLAPLTRAEEPAGEPVSAKLQQQLLTDENIADLCRASIKQKYDMVDVEDEIGAIHKVPRCVANYQAMRDVADAYLKQEETAKQEIAAVITNCEENPEQASCLDAGRNIASKAADLHEGLSKTAETAIERLAAGPSVGAQ